jgi:methyltransferase (TIGR00027 family)
VAFARAAGGYLPRELILAEDPYGARFAEVPYAVLSRLAGAAPRLTEALLANAGLLGDLVVWMQLRTRAIDDALLDFLEEGGRQVIILGAGYDARARRFAPLLGDAAIFEIDHPHTQTYKLERTEKVSGVRYVPWDFERMATSELPEALGRLGLDRTQPTLTIWEGVTMYLSAEAIDQSLRAIHAFGAPGSRLTFNYVDQSALDRPAAGARTIMQVVRRSGEPFRFGIAHEELSAFLATRGFTLRSDTREHALVERYMPTMSTKHACNKGRSIALAIAS